MKPYLLFLLTLIVTACVPPQMSANELVNSSWLLRSYGLVNAQKEALLSAPVTLLIDEAGKKVSGSSGCNNCGCNNYGADLMVQGNRLTIKNVISTLIACTEPGVAEQEMAYVELLGRVTTFEKAATTLILITETERLEFSVNE
jgi:heat shock protein HslJ